MQKISASIRGDLRLANHGTGSVIGIFRLLKSTRRLYLGGSCVNCKNWSTMFDTNRGLCFLLFFFDVGFCWGDFHNYFFLGVLFFLNTVSLHGNLLRVAFNVHFTVFMGEPSAVRCAWVF